MLCWHMFQFLKYTRNWFYYKSNTWLMQSTKLKNNHQFHTMMRMIRKIGIGNDPTYLCQDKSSKNKQTKHYSVFHRSSGLEKSWLLLGHSHDIKFLCLRRENLHFLKFLCAD